MIRLIRTRSKYTRIAGFALMVLGLGLAVAALIVFVHQSQTEPQPPAGAVTSRSAPSSIKPQPQAVASYHVPPTDPKYIAIPSIDVPATPIRKLGLTKNGQIAVPGNIYETGWYDGSSRPGEMGAMFIYGHVSNWTANGIFYNLKQLKPGNRITITRGDDTSYTYQVVKAQVYAYDDVDMNQVLAPVEAGTPGLNLMTCTGQIIKGTSEFNERLVVFTELVDHS